MSFRQARIDIRLTRMSYSRIGRRWRTVRQVTGDMRRGAWGVERRASAVMQIVWQPRASHRRCAKLVK